MKKPTLRDVARLAGTSVSTASVVLSRTSNKFVSDELRRKVMEAAAQLQYRPNIPARRMRGKPGRFLAILVPQCENVYFNRIVISAENYANAHDYTLSIFSTFDEEERELKFINNLISLQVDGVLISPAQYKSKSVDLLRQVGIPFVVIDRPVEGTNFDFVTTDYYQGGYQAARILLSSGHRKLAFFGWARPLKVIADRRAGFEAAVREAGIPLEEVVFWEGERKREAACQAAHEILPRTEITAIFAGHHQIGEGIVDALREQGKRIPEDVSVVIFGNPPWASIISPRLTCIAQPESAIGARAAELMIRRLENPDHTPGTYVLPIEVFERESVRRL
ncbi:MAG: LacI family transcriptional regulator [Firmicutes bacterium]|nr:LacI family transcriptional regulator [Bacillota bacterium]